MEEEVKVEEKKEEKKTPFEVLEPFDEVKMTPPKERIKVFEKRVDFPSNVKIGNKQDLGCFANFTALKDCNKCNGTGKMLKKGFKFKYRECSCVKQEPGIQMRSLKNPDGPVTIGPDKPKEEINGTNNQST